MQPNGASCKSESKCAKQTVGEFSKLVGDVVRFSRCLANSVKTFMGVGAMQIGTTAVTVVIEAAAAVNLHELEHNE